MSLFLESTLFKRLAAHNEKCIALTGTMLSEIINQTAQNYGIGKKKRNEMTTDSRRHFLVANFFSAVSQLCGACGSINATHTAMLGEPPPSMSGLQILVLSRKVSHFHLLQWHQVFLFVPTYVNKENT